MDPDAAYDAMIQAEKSGDWDAVAEHAEALRGWTDNGGFEPNRPNWRAHLSNATQRANARKAGRTIAEINGMEMHD